MRLEKEGQGLRKRQKPELAVKDMAIYIYATLHIVASVPICTSNWASSL